MRVLLVGPRPRLWTRDRLPWLAHAASALRRLGHEVTAAGYRESWAASPTLRARAGRVPGGAGTLARVAAAMDRRRDRVLVAAARALRPQLTILLKGEVFSDETIASVKRAAAGPIVAWWVDDPFVYPDSVRQFSLLDQVFVFDRAYIADLAAIGIGHASFLPCACDETVYRPLALSPADQRRYSADVSFIASYYPPRAALVRALAEAGVDVGLWGTGWDGAIARGEVGDRLVPRGGIVDDHGAAKIYNASKIGINLHHTHARLGGVNTRTFELLAAGTLALIDRIAGVEELLEPEREVVCYGSAEEAVTLARRYLEDAPGRSAITERGRARVLAEHTYVRRMETLVRATRVAC